MQDLQPHGALEQHLVERIALTLWQLNRLARYQRAAVIRGTLQALEGLSLIAALDARKRKIPFDGALDANRVERRIIECIVPSDADLAKIIRYESHLNRQLYQAMHELEALQARRKGAPAPLARLDVNLPAG